MLPAHIKPLIARLDAGSFTAFVEGLINAEAGRLGMPATSVVMSDALTDNDAGLDARLEAVPAATDGLASAIPTGAVGLQLKATKRKTPSAFDLPTELRKEGPRTLLAGGGTYVLVSSQDLNPAQRTTLEQALADEATAVANEFGLGDVSGRTVVWDAQTLAGITNIHPNPAIEIGLVDFGAALTLDELLDVLRAAERPFQSDPARENAIDRLRERVESAPDDPQLLWLHGDPGAGKTRTIAEALNVEQLRDTVLYVEGADGLRTLLTTLIRNAKSRGILFADEVDAHDAADAFRRLGAASGRWRMVAVTSLERRSIAEGGRNIVLPPLDPDATRRLVEQHSGLSEDAARTVAEVAAGFPELALRLAEELRADPNLDLVRLARLPQSAELLERALGDNDVRRHLAPIALFAAVGFDDELRYELEAVAGAFGLDAAAVEHYCDAELDRRRFVSRAGRYRLVSPLLVAVWLATDLIEQTPRFDERIFALPEPLLDAFIRQLDFFGRDAPHLPTALARVIQDERFRRPQAFNEAAGRLLRASAAIIPTQVADAIRELLAAASNDDLLRLPRRDLVWALQILLWWPETWESAVEGLYLLAQHENETWSNNATGVFPSAFTIYLSGSTVPYGVRAAWLAQRIAEAGPENVELLANAAVAGLGVHHSRVRVGFRGGGEPADWQPETGEEYVESRRTAWHLLLALRDRAEGTAREAVTKRLGQALRVVYGARLADQIHDDLRARTWSVPERSDLAAGLRDVLQYEEPPAEIRDEIQALHDSLLGDDLNSRLPIILGMRLWDLHADRATIHDVPPLLVATADRLAERQGDGIELALSTGQELVDQETRYALFRLVTQRLGAERVGAEALRVRDWPAVSAALSVADELGESTWADRVLDELSQDEPERVPELLSFVDLNDERIERVLVLVEEGRAPGAALARLLYGARIRSLDEANAIRVLEAVRASDNTEAALGMLDQWLDEHEERSEAISRIAGELASQAVMTGSATMRDYYIQRLIESDVLDASALLPIWEARMLNRDGLVEQVDRLMTERVLRDPATAEPRIFELVRRGRHEGGFGLFSSTDLALLSQLAAATSPDEVWHELERWPEDDLRWALHHMSWGGGEPDPLVRAFLLSERLRELADEASVCFFNTLGVVVGPYYRALERELARADQWRAGLEGTSAEWWARELVTRYERDIEWHRQREQEEGVHLR
jgi:hypothetical protein